MSTDLNNSVSIPPAPNAKSEQNGSSGSERQHQDLKRSPTIKDERLNKYKSIVLPPKDELTPVPQKLPDKPADSVKDPFFNDKREQHQLDSKIDTENKAIQSKVPLGFQTEVLAHPSKLPDNGKTNFLVEQWIKRHGEKEGVPFNAQPQISAAEIAQKINAIGFEARIDKSLEETLSLLAKDTVAKLQAEGIELTETEYIYLVSETVAEWMRHNPDSPEIRHVQLRPAEIVQSALEYCYRREIGAVYSKHAELAVKELNAGNLDADKREAIVAKHFPCGDYHLFNHMVLNRERSLLSEQVRVLNNNLQQEFKAQYQKELGELSQLKEINIKKFNREIERLKKEFAALPDVASRISEVESAIAENNKGFKKSFSHLVDEDDWRKVPSPIEQKNDSILDQAVASVATPLFVEHAEKFIKESYAEVEYSKRYGELEPLITRERVFTDKESAEFKERQQEIANLKRELSRSLHLDQVTDSLEEIERNDFKHHYSAVENRELYYKGNAVPRAMESRNAVALFDTLKLVSGRLYVRQNDGTSGLEERKLTPAEASDILKHYGDGEKFLALLKEHPTLEADVEKYLAVASGRGREVDLGSEFASQFDKKLTASRKQVIDDLVKSTRDYAGKRAKLVDQITIKKNGSDISDSLLAKENELRNLDKNYYQNRHETVALLRSSEVLNGHLDNIIAVSGAHVATTDAERLALSGDFLKLQRTELSQALRSDDPVASTKKFIAQLDGATSIERILADKESAQKINAELARLDTLDGMLVSKLLAGEKISDEIFEGRLRLELLDFSKIDRADSQTLKGQASTLKSIVEQNEEIFLGNRELVLQLEASVRGSGLESYAEELVSKSELVTAVGPERFKTIEQSVKDYQEVAEREGASYAHALRLSELSDTLANEVGAKPDGNSRWANAALGRYLESSLGDSVSSELMNAVNVQTAKSEISVEQGEERLKGVVDLIYAEKEEGQVGIDATIDERVKAFQDYESALIITKQSASLQTEAQKTSTSQGSSNQVSPEENPAIALTRDAAPLVARIHELAKEYGKVIPLDSEPESEDHVVREIQNAAKADYEKQVSEIYQQLSTLDQQSEASIDLDKVHQQEKALLSRARAQSYIEGRTNALMKAEAIEKVDAYEGKAALDELGFSEIRRITAAEFERAGLSKEIPVEELVEMATAIRAKPISDRILEQEIALAKKYSNPDDIPYETRKQLQDDYQLLGHVTKESRLLSASEFYQRVQEVAKETRDTHKARHAVEQQVKGWLSESSIRKWYSENPEIQEKLTEDQVVEIAAQKRVATVLTDYQGLSDEIAKEFGQNVSLDKKFSGKLEDLNLLPKDIREKYEPQYRAFLTDISELEKDYPEHISAERLLSMQTMNIRRNQVLGWIEHNSEKSWPELVPELQKNGGFDVVSPNAAKQHLYAARIMPIVNELGELKFKQGFLSNPARKYEIPEMQQQLAEVEAKIAELEEKLVSSAHDMGEIFDRAKLNLTLGEYHGLGYKKWVATLNEDRAKQQAEEDARGWGMRMLDIGEEALKSIPKVVESAGMLTLGNIAQLDGALSSMVRLENPLTGARDAGAAYVEGSRSFFNNHIWGGSCLGSDEQLAAMGQWQMAMAVNPLGHAGKATIEPVFSAIELSYDESARAIYNSHNGTEYNYREFAELQQVDPILKNAKRGLYAVEIAGSIALMYATGGGAGTTTLSRIASVGRAMQVSGGMAAAGAIGQELLLYDDIDLERLFDNTLSGTAQSMMFMSAMTGSSAIYVRARFGKPLPATPEEFLALSKANPAEFKRLTGIMQQAEKINSGIDFLDAQKDFADSLANLDNVKDLRDLAGAAIVIGVSSHDAFDYKSNGSGDHLNVNHIQQRVNALAADNHQALIEAIEAEMARLEQEAKGSTNTTSTSEAINAGTSSAGQAWKEGESSSAVQGSGKSLTGNAIRYANTRAELEEQYIATRISELEARQSEAVSTEVRQELAEAAKGIVGYFDRKSGNVVTLTPETLQGSATTRDTRIAQAAVLMHELEHRKLEQENPSQTREQLLQQETQAWVKTAEYLQDRGYALRFNEAGTGWTIEQQISKEVADNQKREQNSAGKQTVLSEKQLADINKFVSANYTADALRVAEMKNGASEGTPTWGEYLKGRFKALGEAVGFKPENKAVSEIKEALNPFGRTFSVEKAKQIAESSGLSADEITTVVQEACRDMLLEDKKWSIGLSSIEANAVKFNRAVDAFGLSETFVQTTIEEAILDALKSGRRVEPQADRAIFLIEHYGVSQDALYSPKMQKAVDTAVVKLLTSDDSYYHVERVVSLVRIFSVSNEKLQSASYQRAAKKAFLGLLSHSMPVQDVAERAKMLGSELGLSPEFMDFAVKKEIISALNGKDELADRKVINLIKVFPVSEEFLNSAELKTAARNFASKNFESLYVSLPAELMNVTGILDEFKGTPKFQEFLEDELARSIRPRGVDILRFGETRRILQILENSEDAISSSAVQSALKERIEHDLTSGKMRYRSTEDLKLLFDLIRGDEIFTSKEYQTAVVEALPGIWVYSKSDDVQAITNCLLERVPHSEILIQSEKLQTAASDAIIKGLLPDADGNIDVVRSRSVLGLYKKLSAPDASAAELQGKALELLLSQGEEGAIKILLSSEAFPNMTPADFDQVVGTFSNGKLSPEGVTSLSTNPYAIYSLSQIGSEVTETLKQEVPWAESILKLRGIQQPQANATHDTWRTQLTPLITDAVLSGALDVSRKADGEILQRYVERFGFTNSRSLLDVCLAVERANTTSDIQPEMRGKLEEFLGRDLESFADKSEILNQVSAERNEITSLLLANDGKLVTLAQTQLGGELLKSVIGTGVFEHGDSVSEIANTLEREKQRNPSQFILSPGHQEVSFEVSRAERKAVANRTERVAELTSNPELAKRMGDMTEVFEFATAGDDQQQIWQSATGNLKKSIDSKLDAISERMSSMPDGRAKAAMESQQQQLLEAQQVLEDLSALDISDSSKLLTEVSKFPNAKSLSAERNKLLQLASAKHAYEKADPGMQDLLNKAIADDSTRVGETKVKQVAEFVEQYLYPHYIKGQDDNGLSAGLRKDLVKAWDLGKPGNHPVIDTANKIEKIDNEGIVISRDTTSVTLVPSKELIRVFSGDLADACFTTQHNQFARGAYPGITAYAIVANRGTSKEKIRGSVLAIETTTPDGEKVLVVRANNPVEAVKGQLDTTSLIEGVLSEMTELAKRTGCTKVVVPVDGCGLSATNRKFVSEYYEKNFADKPTVQLESTRDTNFNGYPVWDSSGENAAHEIWQAEKSKDAG